MAKDKTYIKLNRKILDWRWYHDANTFRVFVHLLLVANIIDNPYEGIIIHRGEKVISYGKLADTLNLTVAQVRTAISHLKSTGEITIKRYSKFQVVTLTNYDYYQNNQQSNNNQIAIKQQSFNNHLTINQQQYKNGKNGKNGKNERENTLAFGKFKNVFLTEHEFEELKRDYPDRYSAKIERLSSYMSANGKIYENHYAKLIEWLEEDEKEDLEKMMQERNKASYDIEELEKNMDII